jgi:hypothetical protein
MTIPDSMRARARAIMAAHDWYPEADAWKQAKALAVCEHLAAYEFSETGYDRDAYGPDAPRDAFDMACELAAWAVSNEEP